VRQASRRAGARLEEAEQHVRDDASAPRRQRARHARHQQPHQAARARRHGRARLRRAQQEGREDPAHVLKPFGALARLSAGDQTEGLAASLCILCERAWGRGAAGSGLPMKPRVVAVCDSAHPPASTAGQSQPGRYPHAPPDSTVAAASAPAAIHRGQARACCTSSGGQRTSTSGSNRRATKVRMEQQASLPPAAQLPCVAAQRQPCSVLLCVHAQRACGERAQHACTAARLHALTGPQQRLASVVPALAGCCRGARHDTDRHLQPSPSALPCLAATAACTGRPRPDPGGRAGLRRSSQPPGPGPARPRGTCAARAGRLRPSPAARAAARAAPARAAARSAARGRPAGTRRRPGRARRRPRAGCAAGRTPHPAARRAARLRATARVRLLSGLAAGVLAVGAAACAPRGASQIPCRPGQGRGPSCYRQRACVRAGRAHAGTGVPATMSAHQKPCTCGDRAVSCSTKLACVPLNPHSRCFLTVAWCGGRPGRHPAAARAPRRRQTP